MLVILVTLAFLGMSVAANRMLLLPGTDATIQRGEPSLWMVLPVAAGLIALLILGLHPPGDLLTLLDRAVTALRGTA